MKIKSLLEEVASYRAQALTVQQGLLDIGWSSVTLTKTPSGFRLEAATDADPNSSVWLDGVITKNPALIWTATVKGASARSYSVINPQQVDVLEKAIKDMQALLVEWEAFHALDAAFEIQSVDNTTPTTGSGYRIIFELKTKIISYAVVSLLDHGDGDLSPYRVEYRWYRDELSARMNTSKSSVVMGHEATSLEDLVDVCQTNIGEIEGYEEN